jgi:hypothetical protein
MAVRPWLTASGGDPFGVVLEFEFLSRTIASKQINDRSRAGRWSVPRGPPEPVSNPRGQA